MNNDRSNRDRSSREGDAGGNDLAAILQRSGIDASTFQPIYEASDEVLNALVIDGDDAVDLWFQLRGLSPQTRHWPVVLGTKNDLSFLRNAMNAYSAAQIPSVIAEGLRMQPGAIIERDPEAAADEEYLQSETYKIFLRGREAWRQTVRNGIQTSPGMPDSVDPYFFQIPRNYRTNRGYSEVYVGLVPTIHSWEVPAYLRFGNWNACPSPAEHVCMMKYWHDLYGSHVVGISHDVVEALVERQPAREADALALAFEQFMYCEDIVSQGHGSIEKLAKGLKILDNWYFWWD